MKTYRVTIQVTTDIVADDERVAVASAVNRIREAIGEDPSAPIGSPGRSMWVTGVARDDRGFLVFGRPMMASETLTVAESIASLFAPGKDEEYL